MGQNTGKSWSKVLKTRSKPKNETEMADEEDSKLEKPEKVLARIRNNIVKLSEDWRLERPRIHRDVLNILHHERKSTPLELVNTMMKELHEQWRELQEQREETLEWQCTVRLLKRENCDLASQVYGESGEDRQKYEIRIAKSRERNKNEMLDQFMLQRQRIFQLEQEGGAFEGHNDTTKAKHEEDIRQLELKYDHLLRDTQKSHESLASGLESKHTADRLQQRLFFEAEQRKLRTKYEGEKENLRTTHLEESEREMRRMKGEYEKKIHVLEFETAALKSDLNKETTALQNRISEINKEHARQESRLIEQQDREKKNHILAISNMQDNFDSRIRELKRQHQLATHSLEKDFESTRSQLHGQISRMEIEDTKTRADFDAAMQQLQQQKTDELARLKAQLEAAHADETRQLRKDVDEYSATLLARDDFKPMPDNEIKARFLDLVKDVNNLARIEWRAEQKVWTSAIVQQLSKNQRLFKKQVLQDTIWDILQKHIFCSPFRVLGEEGRTLEKQWNQECGRDPEFDYGRYTWPKPMMEAERWRYVAIKEIHASLRKPAPSEWDKRAELKMAFLDSIDALKENMKLTLGEIAILEQGSLQAIDKLASKAARMWLEFGMQRCRIVVVLKGSILESAEEKVQRAENDTLELVVKPQVKRFGNSKGLELHTDVTVEGCDGESVEISTKR